MKNLGWVRRVKLQPSAEVGLFWDSGTVEAAQIGENKERLLVQRKCVGLR